MAIIVAQLAYPTSDHNLHVLFSHVAGDDGEHPADTHDHASGYLRCAMGERVVKGSVK